MDDLVRRLEEEAECYKGKTQSCLLDAKNYIIELEKKVEKLTEYIDAYQNQTNIMLDRIKKIEDELEEKKDGKKV